MGQTERTCSPTVQHLQQRIALLESENIRLRALLVQRDSELVFARQDCVEMAAASAGLPRRMELARRVDSLSERLESLLREKRRVA